MNNRQELSYSLKQKMDKKEFIVVAGVSSLSQVRCCQTENCDLILLYPDSKAGKAQNPFLAGYLPFGNTNDAMIRTASEVMPIIDSKNILAGLNGSDPFKLDHLLIHRMKQFHFAGIHNYPAMTLVDGVFGTNIDSLNLGIDKEITLLKHAMQEDLFTCAMVRSKKQIHAMLKSGVEMLIFYLGLGERETVRSGKKQMQYISYLKELTEAARKINPHIPLLFFDEQITAIDEIHKIAKAVPDINGYCLLPVTRSDYSHTRLSLEIKQLKRISLT
ncbi:MAG: phosphoenolpyruvate hydrolase family protein [Lachnospiraceae bacterium]|nr:phosphoenolpyruvate hydrolase family protein [Lachnospiraceae bacterium]